MGTLRYRVLSGVAGLVGICLIGSGLTLYRLHQFNRSLTEMQKVTLPLERVFSQLRRDGRAYSRETEKRLGRVHWQDAAWIPRPNPVWQKEAIQSELAQAESLLKDPVHVTWLLWVRELQKSFLELEQTHEQIVARLKVRDPSAVKVWQDWSALRSQWDDSLENGWLEFQKLQNSRLQLVESRVFDLKTGLQIILFTVLGLSGILVWLANRALAPLASLAQWVRQVSGRTIQKADKDSIPHLSIYRDDEVATLAREFHRLSTSLLERERTVNEQHKRLEEQNQRLTDLGALNADVLNSIQAALFVVSTNGQLDHINPAGMKLIGVGDPQLVLGLKMSTIAGLGPWSVALPSEHVKEIAEVTPWLGRSYRHRWQQLDRLAGFILIIEDVTEELKLHERLSQMEGLAAMGKMSAQVAHEVRNPLHSIGLEVELALEHLRLAHPLDAKQSLHSIQHSVDRLEAITDNYLKLSRLSAGKKEKFLVSDLVQNVIATYAESCSSQGIVVQWSGKDAKATGYGDLALCEQGLGNLMRNAIQAAVSTDNQKADKKITLEWGDAWVRIEDSGRGVDPLMKERLFEAFVSNKAQGTGLGLSFALRVFREQGGDLRLVESQTGQGACFEVMLGTAKGVPCDLTH